MNMQDKIRGCFLGIAIGDALGKPVESYSAKRIKDNFKRITQYEDCNNHKYFQDDLRGTTTDDWQLTKAVAQGFIDAGDFDLESIAKRHVEEFHTSVRGWGSSTRESVENLVNDMNWEQSGVTEQKNRGLGNGVSMKVAPVGIFLAMKNLAGPSSISVLEKLVSLALMTHRTDIAVSSGIAHSFATMYCMTETPETFNKKNFIEIIVEASNLVRYFPKNNVESQTDNLADRFNCLFENLSDEEIIEKFNEGTCYVYNSLPFTYAFLLKNPNSIESLFDCISAGGDTDSNGSMLAGLMGALHGTKIFPDYLIDGLNDKEEVLKLADEFFEKFKGNKNEL